MNPASAPSEPGRLTKNYQYRRAYREGRIIRGERLWLYLLPTHDGQTRLGVSISRGVIKKTTARNRLKRTIKEWFRQRRSNAGEDNYEAVVVLKKDAPVTRAGLKLIREELSRLFRSAKLLTAEDLS